MMTKPFRSIFVCATLAIAGNASATSILYFADLSVGPDHMAGALAALPGSFSVITATDHTDFSTQLGGGTFDLAILAVQNSFTTEPGFSSLEAFVNGGGAAIIQTWVTGLDLSAFDAAYSGSTNHNQVTVNDPSLAAGLSTNPISLINPGWGIYSTDLDISGGSSAAVFEGDASAIVVGNGGRTIVNGFLTDTISSASDAERLYTNEIYFVTSGSGSVSVPDGGATLALLGVALGGISLARRKTV